MNFALISIAINIVVALALFPFFGFVAVAFATSLAAWAQIALLGETLRRRGLFKPDARLASRFPRIVGATLAMAGFLWLVLGYVEALAGVTFGRSWIAIVLIAAAGALVYGLAALALGAFRISDYKAYARPRPEE
jgi:putative peptidoglycan lipid II flippase